MSPLTTWGILLSPLISAFAIVLTLRRRPRAAGAVSIAAILIALALSLPLVRGVLAGGPGAGWEVSLPWIDVPGLHIELGLLVDPLTVLMLLVVTVVGGAIHVYSWGYMGGDPGFARYFASLSLFTFSMLGIVLSNNLIQIFIFWELVAVSSYILIGFWFERPAAAEAGKKAFLVNRVGDFGFLVGILILSLHAGTFNFGQLDRLVHEGALSPTVVTTAALLVFSGAVGKSAQFPLHVWLPDAMEGPTPVSALIHAATMVAAGVFLVARTFFLFAAAPLALDTVAIVGGFTALFAATIACTVTDIKRILAYSTLSQLGYMMMALGCGGVVAGMFHLTTHAFFKALLFLAAGSVIHGLHTQEIWEMGGLHRTMRLTTGTFLVGGLALAGVFPLSGFWSKEAVLSAALARGGALGEVLFAGGLATAFLTAFYMTRLAAVAFFGAPRTGRTGHESPAVMTGPLLFLAAGSALGGLLAGGSPGLLAGMLGQGGEVPGGHAGGHSGGLALALASSAAALGGIALGWRIYAGRARPPEAIARRLGPVYRVVARKYYIDEAYLWLIRNVQDRIAALSNLFDWRVLIGGMVNGTAGATKEMGDRVRRLQTGRLHFYALILLLGVTALLFASVLL